MSALVPGSAKMSNFFLRVAILGEKAPTGLLLTAVGALKFGFGTLLLFGLLFETPVTTWALGDLGRLADESVCHHNIAKSQ